jgi:hypothetical protein
LKFKVVEAVVEPEEVKSNLFKVSLIELPKI